MTTSIECWPWFHAEYAPLAVGPQTRVNSGCGISGDGNIHCAPEAMRASAESQLRAAGWGGSLSLEGYTLARYMHSEVGNGTIEERVAVGEAAMNRAKRERLAGGVLGLLLFRQPQGHPNRGFYGPIHGIGTGVSTAPYGRWASTSQDPTVLTLLLAELVASGKSGNFANDADDQDGPEAWISMGQGALTGYVQRLASNGKYWVGPLPGIDHWHTFLQFTPGIKANTPEGVALMQRGIEALTLPAQRPTWLADMPVCGKPIGGPWLWIAGILSTLAGAWWFTQRGPGPT